MKYLAKGGWEGQCCQDLLIYWTQLQWSIDLDVLLIKDKCIKVVLHSSLHDFVCKYWPCIDETVWWWNWTLNNGFRSLSCVCVFSCKWTYQSVENTWLFLVTSLKKGISAFFTLENYIVSSRKNRHKYWVFIKVKRLPHQKQILKVKQYFGDFWAPKLHESFWIGLITAG